MNGGSTFIIRLCNMLLCQGYKVVVVLLTSRIEESCLSELKCRVIHVQEMYKSKWLNGKVGILSMFMRPSKYFLKRLTGEYGNHFHVLGIFGLIAAYRIKSVDKSIRISTGVYHQYEFIYPKKRDGFFILSKRLFSNLPSENVVFFNTYTRDRYSMYYNKDYSESNILPIGIKLPVRENVQGCQSKPLRFTSIGGLNSFKTYNLHMLLVVKNLIAKGYSLIYNIYGDGELHQRMHELIKEYQIDHCVNIHGSIPYNRFEEVCSGSFAFIGSGTAILEACALGVPGLVGIESIDQPVTYGFLDEIEGFNYNEFIPNKELKNMEECIEKLITMSSDEYQKKCIQCKEKAKEFNIENTIQGFLKLESAAQKITYQPNFGLLFLFFLRIIILDLLSLDTSFRMRRNICDC